MLAKLQRDAQAHSQAHAEDLAVLLPLVAQLRKAHEQRGPQGKSATTATLGQAVKRFLAWAQLMNVTKVFPAFPNRALAGRLDIFPGGMSTLYHASHTNILKRAKYHLDRVSTTYGTQTKVTPTEAVTEYKKLEDALTDRTTDHATRQQDRATVNLTPSPLFWRGGEGVRLTAAGGNLVTLPAPPAVFPAMPIPTPGSPTPLTLRLPDGRTLGLTRYGNPAHRAVVFHHGFGSSGLELPDDAALLARLQLQILAPDRPGVGRSSVYRRLSFPSFADDVVAMLDALHIREPVGVMGWSVGGVHALALAARHPARVAAVQLLSTCLPLGERATAAHLSPVWKLLHWGQIGFPWLNRTVFLWLSRQWQRHPNRTIDWFIRGMRPAEAAVTARYRALLRDAAGPGFAHAGRGVYDDAQAWCRPPGFRIEDVRVPVRLWHGLADGVWAPGNIPYLAGRLGGAPVRLLPGQGHMLYLENWPAILEEMCGMLLEPLPAN